MKAKLLLSLTALAAAAALAVPAAMADVARFQGSVMNFTLSTGSTLSIVVSPCDGSFLGTLTTAGVSSPVSGKMTGTAVTFDGANATLNGTLTTTGLASGTTALGTLSSSSTTSFANHGAFVSSVPPSERSQAAHSCIGMPVKSYASGHGHQAAAGVHGKDAAPGQVKKNSGSTSTTTTTTTSTTPTGPGNSQGHGNSANAPGRGNSQGHGNSGNAPGQDAGTNGADNGNGNGGGGHGKP
jgi:hypothetical protein